MDRREAIREAFKHAKTGDAVIITGKGTDPYIMGSKWKQNRVGRRGCGARGT